MRAVAMPATAMDVRRFFPTLRRRWIRATSRRPIESRSVERSMVMESGRTVYNRPLISVAPWPALILRRVTMTR